MVRMFDVSSSADFLAFRSHASGPRVPPVVAFNDVAIKFAPVAAEAQQHEVKCANDIAICNRECERLFGEKPAELEEPCKLAVAQHFLGAADGQWCFAANAAVQTRGGLTIHISDVKVGDELRVGRYHGDHCSDGWPSSRVVALLHVDRDSEVSFLQIAHGGGEALSISAKHLVWARLRRVPSGAIGATYSMPTASSSSTSLVWDWVPAQEIRAGDELQDAHGLPSQVRSVKHGATMRGAFAPLTECGEVLVGGARCSCYAPPPAWGIPHDTCHAAMLPLRALDVAKAAVERWSHVGRGRAAEPLLSIQALWLLPRGCGKEAETMHPYVAGLLTVARACKAAGRCWDEQTFKLQNDDDAQDST